MQANSDKLLASLIEAAEQVSEMVDSWRPDGDLQNKLVPFAGDVDDLETLADDLDSAAEDVLTVADGVRSGKRDSADLFPLLAWREDIDADLEGLRDRDGAAEPRRLISDLFVALKAATEQIGDAIRGRRDFYVYVHKTEAGKVFYVGRGTGKRAWSGRRHPLWHKYVDEHLGGKYEVEVVIRDLTETEAEKREAELMEQYPDQLVNVLPGGTPESSPKSWGIGITFDLESGALTMTAPPGSYDAAYFEALDTYHRIRAEIDLDVEHARPLEKDDPERAVAIYRDAVARLDDYAKARPREPGLKGELDGPWRPLGVELTALDRLTLVLWQQKRFADLVEAVDVFSAKHPDALLGSLVGDKICARRDKAAKKIR